MDKNIKTLLRDMKFKTESDLQKSIIADILSQGTPEDITSYIKDVLQGGCVNGTVSMLIYYTDTEKFFKRHFVEILELLEDTRKELGDIPKFELNSNNLAWFGYESIIINLASELEIEY